MNKRKLWEIQDACKLSKVLAVRKAQRIFKEKNEDKASEEKKAI